MRIIVNTLSALALVPLVLVLAYFGLVGLLGALPMTVISWGLAVSVCISAFFFRPDDYGSLLGARQGIHLVLVGLALWFVATTIESPNTDSSYYRPIYFWFLGLPFLLIAPVLHRLILKKEAQQAAPSNGG
jgi:hypothetical protein